MSNFAETTVAKSDQINNVDLIAAPLTITITKVVVDTRQDQPVSIGIEGTDKVYRPCKGMRRVILDIWGGDQSKYIGRKLTLYRDPDVRFGADTTGGTRISHASHIDGPRKVTVPVSRGKVKAYMIAPIAAGAMTTDTPPPAAPDNAEQLAREAAAQGKQAFTDWWNSETGKLCRDAVRGIMPELQKIAADAEPKDDPECPI